MAIRLSRETHAPQPADGADRQPEVPPESSPRCDDGGLRRRTRPRGWQVPITDGPFAESKEMIGG